MKYIKKFESLRMTDVAQVGGKNASLGEMINQLVKKGIRVPLGFAITADAYWYVIDANEIREPLEDILSELTDAEDLKTLKHVGKKARSLFLNAKFPEDLTKEIIAAYHQLSREYNVPEADVAVRSSATSEDTPEASFAGQQDSYLNVRGEQELIEACKKAMASLFNDRAIVYRMDKGFDHFQVALSIGVQKMIRSDLACSGVMFTLDTESGFKDVVVINASYGLGESIVQGIVVPDEWYVHKPTLEEGYRPIVKKVLGTKLTKKIYADKSMIKQVSVPKEEQKQFCLTDDEILELARSGILIERHYSKISEELKLRNNNSSWMPMDIEWAKDGEDGHIYIIQARPETVHGAQQNTDLLKQYAIKDASAEKILVTGQSIGQKIASGTARVFSSLGKMGDFNDGDVLVTYMTDPDWVPIMKRAAGIVTESGGRTCHAAIVSRELGIPAIVGAEGALKKIKNNHGITIDCSQGNEGYVYDGRLPIEETEIKISKLQKPEVDIMVNLGIPDQAFSRSFLPVAGVGLARIEFIISNNIRIHPMALLNPEAIKEKRVQEEIEDLTSGYPDKQTYFIDLLSQDVGMIAAAFYPRPVIVRFSDFKSNEYRNLIGGSYFEPQEANPMMGLRGASRYYHEQYRAAFALECAAMKKVREVMGLKNVKVMIPFVRTVDEAHKVLEEMVRNGLKRGDDDLEVIMMCEVPGDVVIFDQFFPLFDGFSIGSNDLAQLTLSIDRDSPLLANEFNERSPAVKEMLKMAVCTARKHKKYISICGQAPSDYPDIAEYLIGLGISSMSLNADSVIPFLMTKHSSKKKKDLCEA